MAFFGGKSAVIIFVVEIDRKTGEASLEAGLRRERGPGVKCRPWLMQIFQVSGLDKKLYVQIAELRCSLSGRCFMRILHFEVLAR